MQSLLDLDALEAHLAHINLSELLLIDSAYIDEMHNMSSVPSSTRPTGSSLPYMEAESEHAGDPEVSSAPDSAPVLQVCTYSKCMQIGCMTSDAHMHPVRGKGRGERLCMHRLLRRPMVPMPKQSLMSC
jgi:hypothetical protein